MDSWLTKLREYDRDSIVLLSKLTEKFPRKVEVAPILKNISENRQFKGLVRALHCNQISDWDLYPNINTTCSFLICLLYMWLSSGSTQNPQEPGGLDSSQNLSLDVTALKYTNFQPELYLKYSPVVGSRVANAKDRLIWVFILIYSNVFVQ